MATNNINIQAETPAECAYAEGFHAVPTDLELAFLLTAICRLHTQNGMSPSIRVLFDTGSQVNLVSKRAVQRCKLFVNTTQTDVPLTGVGGIPVCKVNRLVRAAIWDRIAKRDTDVNIQLLVIPHALNDIPTPAIERQYAADAEKYTLAGLSFRKTGRIDAIFGAAAVASLFDPHSIELDVGVRAQQTEIGYVISGRLNHFGSQSNSDVKASKRQPYCVASRTMDITTFLMARKRNRSA